MIIDSQGHILTNNHVVSGATMIEVMLVTGRWCPVKLIGSDPETHLLVSSSSTGQNLVQIAELKKYDEIIIGVRERSKVGKLLLGSTAQYVILHASCPVITIK